MTGINVACKRSVAVGTPASYKRDAREQMVLLNNSRQTTWQYLKTGHDLFLPLSNDAI
jgi:hypothetical protein